MTAAPRKRTSRRQVALRPGATFGRYRVGRLLHEGGMAKLYAVQALRPGPSTTLRTGSGQAKQPLILKVPKLGSDHPLSGLVAFENELRILERLRGAHVPKLVAAGDLLHQPYLLLECIEGNDLARAVARAPVDLDTLRDIGIRLCRAVQVLHHQNVIHLDLNPNNVRSRADGTMVLIDYGLAHHAALPDLHDAAFGEEEGTTGYIAPEQLHHVRTDSRSDIYALGAILYQLATGHYPFGRPNLLSLKRRLVAPPVPPRAHRHDLPPWLQEIILRCLETKPEDRYATAKRVAHLLAHPESVPDTRRAHRRKPPGIVPRLRAWASSIFQKFDDEVQRPHERLATSPHVLVALDLAHCSESHKQALRRAVRRMSVSEPKSYFTCLSVLPAQDMERAREHGQSAPEIARQMEMRNWAQPLHLPEARMVFQVLPGEPVATLLGYARRHLVDHIILGAGSFLPPRRTGSVLAAVAAQAECTVTVVRTRRDTSK